MERFDIFRQLLRFKTRMTQFLICDKIKMMKKQIKNIFGESLDMLIEGNINSDKVLIFVHGFGTDKNEGFATFADLAKYLKNDFVTVRFDLSGYGKSGGEDYEFQFQKAAGDVDSVIRYARKKMAKKRIFIIAHSLGAFIVSLLSPYMIEKIAFTAIPNSNMNFVISELKKRIISKGGKIDENNITIYPRTSGAIQKIGKDFWRTLKFFDPIGSIAELGNKTQLKIFKPLNDEVLKNKYFKEYKKIKNIEYTEVNGDHNFKDKKDRESLFRNIKLFFLDNPGKV